MQEEVLARSQNKLFYQHLLANFQQLKSSLESSRPCFLLPRGNTTTGSYLAVSCALDDDLAAPEDARTMVCIEQPGEVADTRLLHCTMTCTALHHDLCLAAVVVDVGAGALSSQLLVNLS
jgi:hypothetical protein